MNARVTRIWRRGMEPKQGIVRRLGARSGTDIALAIIHAFLKRRSLTQADLAREVGVQVPALRRHLAGLVLRGWPLESEDDHPHVWWSVPKGWFPGAVAFAPQEVVDLVRQLGRMPRSAARDRLLRRVLEAAPRQAFGSDDRAVIAPTSTEAEERHLDVAQDSATRPESLHFRYFSASRGTAQWRYASVQRVVVGPPPRLLALCHRDNTLKWFRVADIFDARLAPTEPYRTADDATIEEVLAQSLDGFHAGATVVCSFVVREPEARWVERNLPGPMTVETIPNGLRIATTTGALLPLARFVVGLGAAAQAETPELRDEVAKLARGALEACVPTPVDARNKRSRLR